MIQSIIIEPDKDVSNFLKRNIDRNCPELEVNATAHSLDQAYSIIDSYKPNIIFSEVEIDGKTIFEIYNNVRTHEFETILIADSTDKAPRAIRFQVSGFLLKPVKKEDLVESVQIAVAKIRLYQKHPEESDRLPHKKIIGIPTMEGFEFLDVSEIIRCEGRQKCTHVVTTLQTDIISSYHIGKFRTLLKGYGFFTCHKSHLINLAFVRKYTNEGFIYLKDRSYVPLARRRKSQFLSQLKLL